MNEEIKIIIRAVTDPAKKAISEVNQELDKVKGSGKETGVTIDAAMKGIGKGVAIAAAAITALTAAMANLGKSAQEVQKGFSKLNTAFLSVGSTTDQAAKSYRELYGFLGDHDKAIETAQSLALITTNEKELAEWTNVLQGAFSVMGDKLPIEGLAEAANESAQVGQLTGVLADALVWAGINEDAFNASLAETASVSERSALILNTLNGIYGDAGRLYGIVNQATVEYNQSQADLNQTLSQASAYTTPLLTSLNNLGTTMLTVFAPALQTISIYLTAFIQLIAEAVSWVGNFFGIVSSADSGAAANMDGYNEAVKKWKSELKDWQDKNTKGFKEQEKELQKLKKITMGFDELNVLSKPSSGSGGSNSPGGASVGAMPTAPDPADFGLGGDALGFGDMKKEIEEATKYIKGFLALVASIAGAFLLWKTAGGIAFVVTAMKTLMGDGATFLEAMKQLPTYAKAYYDTMKGDGAFDKLIGKVKIFAGILAIVAGAILTIKGYSDAWVNGLDWANFGEILGGIALIIGGLALIFGKTGAAFGLFAGGISMVVLSIKDMITNGANVQNVLTLIIGVIATVTGALMLMNKELLLNAARWVATTAATVAHKTASIAVKAATVAVTAAQTALNKINLAAIGNWIKHTAAMVAHKVAQLAVKVATVAVTVAQTALNFAMSLSPLTWIVIAIAAVVAAFVLLWNNCDGFRQFWIDMWEGIKKAFKATVDWIKQACIDIGNFFVNLWNGIKNGSVAAWNGIVNAFKAAGTWFNDSVIKPVGKFFTNMWNGFKDGAKKAWEGVKNIFSSVASFFSTIFTKAWQGVKNVFSTGGKIFNGIKDGIINAFKKVVNAIISGINKVVKLPFQGLNGILDRISGLKIAGLEPFKWLTWRAPIPQLPMLAKGGIVDSATLAMIGERGKEAVIPLENNTGWMDILADRLAERQAAPSKIVLMLDGKELGYATVNSINNLTRQTGRLPLVLA